MERLRDVDPYLVATALVGAVALGLHVAGQAVAVSWLLGGYAVVVAVREARQMLAHVRAGTFGIDVLAVMAIVATVAVGEFVAAWIVVLMLTGGESLERLAAGRARRALQALLERAPRIAHRRAANGDVPNGDVSNGDVSNGTVVDVPVEDVAVGDVLVVRPGEVVPVDGILLDPVATVDESQLTGEPLPVERVEGDDLMSGSLNGAAAISMEVTATAADSQYQHILELVRAAEDSRAPMIRLADRVAVPFTAFAVVVAGLAWWASGDAARAAEVLVVATPCPLLIAAPVAFMAGMGRSSRNGIIVKDGGTLERLSRLATAAFDKTGTLTHGNPTVSRVVVAPTAGDLARTPDDLLRLAASVEQFSGHALATAVVGAAEDRGLGLLPADHAHEEVAHGITATVAGRRVSVGKGNWTSELVGGFDRPDLAPGELSVHVAADDTWVGSLVLADGVRPEAAETITDLRRLGVAHVVMLTGDGERTARHVAAAVGVDEVHADCLPSHKVDVVAELPARPVMMVGDGVNDAPALAAADVGVAMGARGSTASSESADVVVMVDDVRRVARAVAIGQRTTRVALQAIWLGVGMSVVLMVVAAFGHIPAVVGAGLQEVVDLACILWALLAARPGRDERREQPPTPVVEESPRAMSGSLTA